MGYLSNLDRILPEDMVSEAPTVVLLRSGTHTARSPHSCVACLGVIAAGERYHTQVYVVDGKLEQQRAHARACHLEEPPPYEDPFPDNE